ncbi:MAG TPA: PilZ domain-containing protein [Methyloceanibacter sp.]|nr:PilZ domain-containing protein [Methyloceanibacter sp.]
MKESAPTARLRRERRTDRPFPKIVPERRRYRRLKVSLQGRFMSEDEREYPCEVIDMSAGGMALLAPISCQVGERIVAYLDNLGRLEGTVARAFEGGFAVQINASVQKRERIVNLLTWYANRELVADERQHERNAPRIAAQKLILPNGDVHDCRVIDVSQSGASIAASVKPPIQSVLVLGRLRGRVVRHHDQGMAIQFGELQDPDSLACTFG